MQIRNETDGAAQVSRIQLDFGLSDGKLARALNVTRQTVRNWRRGEPCPAFVQNALGWMLALYSIDPTHGSLPSGIRRPAPANDNHPMRESL